METVTRDESLTREWPDVAAIHPGPLPDPTLLPGETRRERPRMPRTPPGMERFQIAATEPGGGDSRRGGEAMGRIPMVRRRLIRKEDFDSRVLREAAEKLNFIYGLAIAYRAPELLDFLHALAQGLARGGEPHAKEFVSRN